MNQRNRRAADEAVECLWVHVVFLRRARSFATAMVPIALASDDDLAPALAVLRDLGVAFAADTRGWSPAALFHQLRREGRLAGDFTEIVFGFRNTAHTRQR